MTDANAVRVIVTRPEHEAPRWVARLRERGFDAVALALITILPASDQQQLDADRAALASCRAVMFVSGNAVRHFFGVTGRKVKWPDGLQAWATGPGTRQALIDEGVAQSLVVSPDADAAQFDSETLWTLVSSQVRTGDEIMIVRGADAVGTGRDWLSNQLAAAGAKVRTAVAYARGVPAAGPELAALVMDQHPQVWLFSSSQAIANLVLLSPGHDWSTQQAVVTHPRIASAARSAGFGVVCESRPDMDAVCAALESLR